MEFPLFSSLNDRPAYEIIGLQLKEGPGGCEFATSISEIHRKITEFSRAWGDFHGLCHDRPGPATFTVEVHSFKRFKRGTICGCSSRLTIKKCLIFFFRKTPLKNDDVPPMQRSV